MNRQHAVTEKRHNAGVQERERVYAGSEFYRNIRKIVLLVTQFNQSSEIGAKVELALMR